MRNIEVHDSNDVIPSMRILINRICMALRGLLNPKNVLIVMSERAAITVLSWNERKF